MLVTYLLLLVFGDLPLIVLARTDTTMFDKIAKLITEWAPLIWLAPDEKFFPLNVEEFLEHVSIGVRGNVSTDDHPVPLPYGPGSERFYLVTTRNLDSLLQDKTSFIYGKNPKEHKVPVYTVVTTCSPNLSFRVSDANSLSDTIKSSMYGPIVPDPHFHVTFWTFYPYNEGKEICFIGKVPAPTLFGSCLGNRKILGNHVGDWEHMSLSFTGKPYPDRMYISTHDAGAYYKYEPVSRLFKYENQVTRKGILQRPNFPPVVRREEGHPILFSAYGSHGMWSAPGEHYYVRVPRLIDKNGYGTAWKTWKNLEIFFFGATRVPYWVKFKGKWGNPQSNCFLLKKLGICELADGPRGILENREDFHCSKDK